MGPRPVLGVGAVIVDDDGRLLVVERANEPAAGRWTLPGGKVEPDERIVEAIAREVREETGLEVTVGDLLGVHEAIWDGGHYVIVDHRAEVTGGSLAAGDDAADVAWMGRSELEAATTTRGLLAFLDRHEVELAP